MDKKKYRQILQEQWKTLTDVDLNRINESTARTIADSEDWAQSETILAYLDFAGEISLDSLILNSIKAGKKVFVPRIKKSGIMTFHRVMDLEPSSLELNYWNIREALENTELFKAQEAGKILILTPGLGFTKDGKRMGRGGGFYDRFLAGIEENVHCMTMGISWKGVLLPDLPVDSHDRKIRKLCCETEIIDCQPLN